MYDADVSRIAQEVLRGVGPFIYGFYFGTRCSMAHVVPVPLRLTGEEHPRIRPDLTAWFTCPLPLTPPDIANALDDPVQGHHYTIGYESQYSRAPEDRNFLLYKLRSQVGQMRYGPTIVFDLCPGPPSFDKESMMTRIMLNLDAASSREAFLCLRDDYPPHMTDRRDDFTWDSYDPEEQEYDDSDSDSDSDLDTQTSSDHPQVLYPGDTEIEQRVSLQPPDNQATATAMYFGVQASKPIPVPLYTTSTTARVEDFNISDWIAFDFRLSSGFDLGDHMVILPDYRSTNCRYAVIWESQRRREENSINDYINSLQSYHLPTWYGNVLVICLNEYGEVQSMVEDEDIEVGRRMVLNALHFVRCREDRDL